MSSTPPSPTGDEKISSASADPVRSPTVAVPLAKDPLVGFPSAVEILGVLVGLVPFLVLPVTRLLGSVSTATPGPSGAAAAQSPPWVATASGAIVMFLCVITVSLLRRTKPRRHVWRGLAAVLLFCLGGFELARGLLVSTPANPAGQAAAPAGAPAGVTPPIDLAAPTYHFLQLWQRHDLQEIYAGALPEFRAQFTLLKVQRILDGFIKVMGPCTPITGPFTYEHRGDGWDVLSEVTCTNGKLPFDIGWDVDSGAARLLSISLKMPPGNAPRRDPVDAATMAHAALDAILAGRVDRIPDLCSPEMVAGLPEQTTLAGQLHDTLAKLGEVKEVKPAEQAACGKHQCLSYEIVTTKGTGHCTFELSYAIWRWQLESFNLLPPDSK